MKKFTLLFVIVLGMLGAFILYQFGPLHFGPVTVKGNLELYAPFDPAKSVVFLSPVDDDGTKPSWRAKLSANGAFTFKKVPPGTYRLGASMRDADDDPTANGGIRSLTIPARGRNPFIVGPLHWRVFTPIKVSTVAPEYGFQSADNVDHLLSSYRGKWVLLHFHRFAIAKENAARLAGLRAAYDAFGKRPDFVVLSIHIPLDDKDRPAPSAQSTDAAAKPLPWVQGEASSASLTSFFPPFGLPGVLLIKPDGTLAARDIPDNGIVNTVALMLPPPPAQPKLKK